jgi:hypothetical protein
LPIRGPDDGTHRLLLEDDEGPAVDDCRRGGEVGTVVDHRLRAPPAMRSAIPLPLPRDPLVTTTTLP